MKRAISVILCAALIVCTSCAMSGCGENNGLYCPDNLGDNDYMHKDGYELVWHDEFDGDALNTDNWDYEIGFIRNSEPQYYTDRTDNVKVEDGVLKIICKGEDYTAVDGTTANFTSGSINTQGKQAFKYGSIEMRAKLPNADNPTATWPAFWMMGIESWWPMCGETDILEMYGQNFNKYEANVHWANENDEHVMLWDTDGKVPTLIYDEPLGNDWHTYGIDWTDKYMRFYCDDKTLGTIDITDEQMTELHIENYLLLNLAMQNEQSKELIGTDFEIVYQIDYVRVYQKTAE